MVLYILNDLVIRSVTEIIRFVHASDQRHIHACSYWCIQADDKRFQGASRCLENQTFKMS